MSCGHNDDCSQCFIETEANASYALRDVAQLRRLQSALNATEENVWKLVAAAKAHPEVTCRSCFLCDYLKVRAILRAIPEAAA